MVQLMSVMELEKEAELLTVEQLEELRSKVEMVARRKQKLALLEARDFAASQAREGKPAVIMSQPLENVSPKLNHENAMDHVFTKFPETLRLLAQ